MTTDDPAIKLTGKALGKLADPLRTDSQIAEAQVYATLAVAAAIVDLTDLQRRNAGQSR